MDKIDKLEDIFSSQQALDQEIIKRRNLPSFTKEEWLQKEVLALMSELAEVLNETNFKWWKKQHALTDEKIKEEIVDLLHFVISISLKMGMDAEELYCLYLKKNKENWHRLDREEEKSD